MKTIIDCVLGSDLDCSQLPDCVAESSAGKWDFQSDALVVYPAASGVGQFPEATLLLSPDTL